MPPKKKTQLYKRPEPISVGEVLTDLGSKKWVLGSAIGSGGFGDIYKAAEGESLPKKDTDFRFVVKIEPKENGPLFVERAFYMRVAKKADVLSWMSSKSLKSLGMPLMHGSGSHDFNGIKHRFIVMDRFSKDLGSLFVEHKRVFPVVTVLQIALQIIEVLEYIHSKDYAHGDIKGSNILLNLQRGTKNQVYLVDFGLASRINTGEFKRDPKKAHNGTLEYTSRDAHQGVSTRRGDLEILAYNMIQWMTSKLPWESLTKPDDVEKAKEAAMKNVSNFLKKSFGLRRIPGALSTFVEVVANTNPKESPDYNKIKNIFVEGIKAEGGKVDGPFEFHHLEEQENNVRKAVKVRPSPRKGAKSKPSRAVELDSDADLFEGQEPKRARKNVKAKKAVATPSWRDCPSAKASKVTKAGVYSPSSTSWKIS